MFKRKKDYVDIDLEIHNVLEEMKHMSSTSEGYSKAASNLEILYRAKGCVNNHDIDVNKLITAGAYLAGIVMILAFEGSGNVIATKALSFIPKGRV